MTVPEVRLANHQS